MNAKKWLNNPLLQFNAHTTTKVATGEILKETQTAIYKGLRFVVTPIKKGGLLCSVRGSLHKYHNQGKHNANDFNINDFRGVVGELKSLFDIDPKRAILRSVEVGVNIETPIPTKEIIKNLVAYNNKGFESMIIDGKATGRTIQKQQYQLKAYDKKQQHPTATTAQHLTRFEIAVKRMAYLSKYKITTLQDLTTATAWEQMGVIIVTAWDNIIYYDKKVNYRILSESERLKLMYYATPRNWEDYTPTQRKRAKQHYTKIIEKAGKNTHYKDIAENIRFKCTSLAGTTTPEQETTTQTAEQTSSVRRCKCCSKDISHKKKGAKYCGKKCNNKYNGQRRTNERRAKLGVRRCECCNKDIRSKRVGAKYCSKKCSNKHYYKKAKATPPPLPPNKPTPTTTTGKVKVTSILKQEKRINRPFP